MKSNIELEGLSLLNDTKTSLKKVNSLQNLRNCFVILLIKCRENFQKQITKLVQSI